MSQNDSYPMSDRARQAFREGKLPLHAIQKRHLEGAGIDLTASEFKRAVNAGVILPAEWHHVGNAYESTDFFDLQAIKDDIDTGWYSLEVLRNPPCIYERHYKRGSKYRFCIRCGKKRKDHEEWSERMFGGSPLEETSRSSMGKTRRGSF